jgi:hypothetical protein
MSAGPRCNGFAVECSWWHVVPFQPACAWLRIICSMLEPRCPSAAQALLPASSSYRAAVREARHRTCCHVQINIPHSQTGAMRPLAAAGGLHHQRHRLATVYRSCQLQQHAWHAVRQSSARSCRTAHGCLIRRMRRASSPHQFMVRTMLLMYCSRLPCCPPSM